MDGWAQRHMEANASPMLAHGMSVLKMIAIAAKAIERIAANDNGLGPSFFMVLSRVNDARTVAFHDQKIKFMISNHKI